VVKKLKYHSLIDKVYTRPNLYVAWEKVKANKGSGGIDDVSIKEIEQNLMLNIEEIHRLLYEDRYQPQPVKRVWIPKPDGNKRPLGIPTVRDRVVQQAILNKLTPIFEPKFLDCSYGFRPNRSAHQSIQKVDEYLNSGYRWVVEVDIEKFFDTINQEKLIDFVAEEIADGRVLRLVRSFLHSGVMEDMKIEYQSTGTPQGGVISPLLANIYLYQFDKEMTESGYKVIRYADDIVILCQKKIEAEQALRKTREILERELNLKLNPEKTKITHKSKGFEFLGYNFFGYEEGKWKGNWKIPRKRAIETFKDKIRYLTRRQQPKSMSEIIKEINPVIRGWGNYFIYGTCKRKFWQLDCWIRDRVKAYKVRGWGKLAHLKYPNWKLKLMGLCSLSGLLYHRRLELLLVRGQRYREAVCGKSARTV